MEDRKEPRSYYSRWLILGGIIIIASFLINKFILETTKLDVSVEPQSLYPDGKSSVTVKLVPLNALNFRAPFVHPKFVCTIEDGADKVTITYSSDSTSIQVHAKYESGAVTLLLKTNIFLLPVSVTIPIEKQVADSDHDGYPDATELTSEEDKMNFRRWFTSIAESQFYQIDPAWREKDRDCAGLLRFAYREALRTHDQNWFNHRSYLVDANIPDVKKYRYPSVPLLGVNIFRVKSGEFSENDLHTKDTVFSPFAEATLLKNHSFFLSVGMSGKRCPAMLFFI